MVGKKVEKGNGGMGRCCHTSKIWLVGGYVARLIQWGLFIRFVIAWLARDWVLESLMQNNLGILE